MSAKRKLAGTALLLALLVCTMGASSIGFDAGQPMPNPGGVPQKLEGKGDFKVDPAEKFFSVSFHAKEVVTKQINSKTVNANLAAETWDGVLDLVKGRYDCWASLSTEDKNGGLVLNKTKIETKTVK